MEVYTDYPCIVVGGCKDARNEYLCLIILACIALGLPLSWRKGLAPQCRGGEFTILSAPARLSVKIKLEAAETLLLHVRQSNVISLRDLSSLVGKVGNIANLLVVWRPFLAPLYAALYSTERTGAHLNCCWTRQIAARFGFELGDPAGKQVWESLAALVAVRLWKAHWQQRRVCLTVRGDSVEMLTLVVNMRPRTRQL